jgi:hypothetical protein
MRAMNVQRPASAETTLRRFSRGEISRQRAMALLGDIPYAELLDRLAARGLPRPTLPEAETNRMATDLARLLPEP